MEQKSIGGYDFLEPIGQGKYAKVYSALHKESNKKVAIKVLERSQVQASTLKNVLNEIAILEKT
jgi:serine/threonine protein kinase